MIIIRAYLIDLWVKLDDLAMVIEKKIVFCFTYMDEFFPFSEMISLFCSYIF